MMLRSLAPVSSPLTLGDIHIGYKALCQGESYIERFNQAICDYFQVRHSFLVSSGKAALSLVLAALAHISPRRQVVIPAYCSFCVPSAVAKAGLEIVLCDVNMDTLDFDLEQLEEAITEETLCVLPVHPFGLVAQIDHIRRLAERKGAFVLEDAAQAAGGSLQGEKLGTLGDVGVFSLSRGKNICAVSGGVVMTNSDYLASKIAKQMVGLNGAGVGSVTQTINALLQAIALAMLLHPRLYWLPQSMPFLKLGISEFSTAFKIGPYSDFLAGIGMTALPRLQQYNTIRRRNAAYLLRHMPDSPLFLIPRSSPQSHPVYLRFPLLIRDRTIRQRIYDALNKQGLGVSMTYPTALSEIQHMIPYIARQRKEFPNAELVSRSILTLPTHPYTTRRDLDRIVSIFGSYV